MAVSLLQTKLFVPLPQAELVSRPGLIKRLDERHRLTLVSAPAGFGKTTLVGAWVEGLSAILPISERVAWLSVDAADDDPIRFWSYVVAALQRVHPGIGETALAMLQTPQPPPVETVLTALLNEIAALIDPLALVLDDYHLVENPSIHEATAFVLDHLPPQMRLIILTRADPPLPLARLRVRGQLAELRAADLRFTIDEAAAFMNRVMGLDLTPSDVAALEARTEGWVAGLQLAALSMQGRADVSDFIAAFAGSHHYIVDYLSEEVLGRQPAEVQAFLLHTCILERMNGPLCDTVCFGESRSSSSSWETAMPDRGSGQAMLERLDKENLFVVRLDEDRYWYRYHHLLAQSLRNRLQQTEPDLIPLLYRRAAAWFEHNGLLEESLAYWVHAQDFGHAAHLMEQRGTEMLAIGEMTALRRWVNMLPIEFVRQRPQLCILFAWTLLLHWDLGGTETWIRSVQECLSSKIASTQNDEMVGHIAAIQAYIAGMEGNDRQASDLCHRALDLLPANSTFLHALIAYMLGTINLRNGDLDGAWVAIEKAGRMSQASGILHIAVPALTSLGIVQKIRGKLHLAYESYQKALQLSMQGRRQPPPVTAMANNSLAEVLYEWNDLEAADRHLHQGLEQSKQWGNAEDLINNAVARARVCRARGDWSGAWDVINQVNKEIPQSQLKIGQIIITQVRFHLDQGDLNAAEQLIRRYEIGARDTFNFNTMGEQVVVARLRLKQARWDEVTHLLERLRTFTQRSNLAGPSIEVLRLQALALYGEKRPAQALASLQSALALAEPGGYIRSFVDEGPRMSELLLAWQCWTQRDNRLQNYVARLVAAFPGTSIGERAKEPPQVGASALIEPLSERELEVLHLLAEGKSNREIGDALFIAVGTVKKHLSNTCGKLGVQNRTACVARARELGLI
jgi:LuxR family maltose regulon positive regulatory protein